MMVSSNLKNNITCPEKPRQKNKVNRLIKAANRKFHLDKNIWNFLLLLVIAILVGSALKSSELSEDKRSEYLFNTAGIIAVAGSLLWTANGIHNQYHDNQRARASQYISSWYSKDLAESVRCIRELTDREFNDICNSLLGVPKENDLETPILRLKYSGNTELVKKISDAQTKILEELLNDKTKQEHIDRVLAFFEQIGADVKLGVADAEYLKDFFYAVVIRYYELLRKYIEYWQIKRNSQSVYCNFVYLARTWEAENEPPKLPKICQTEYVLKDDEISLLEKHA